MTSMPVSISMPTEPAVVSGARGAKLHAIEWRTSTEPVAYLDALAVMTERARAIAKGEALELVWLLEHPPLYTAGTSARADDLLTPERFAVHATGRGGQYTYHGPGQRVVYLMLDLRARGGDVRAYVQSLEAWIIAALAELGVTAGVRDGRIGVWVERRGADGYSRDDKIAALGIRVSRGVTMHGIAINVAPDLEHFSGIVPCGISDHGVTSLADLGIDANMIDVDRALRATFASTVGERQG
ncbi:MAG: lipoyl(octanoyl) transferase LipB [Hyphomicrobium aestuarii]|nr:lipoyl(octanoyl) transferase LipB [Hyphomicrobium aestuarii]